MTDRKWYEDHDNLTGLARWLNGEYYFQSPDGVLYFFEKPWKYGREYGLWRLYEGTKDVTIRASVLEALDDEEMTAEEVLAAEEERNAQAHDQP
jgi:hypothetical protein